MIYIIINFLVAAYLIYASFSIDKLETKRQSSSVLVNLILFCGTIYILMGVTDIFALKKMNQVALLVGRLTYVLMGFFAVFSCNYMMVYPNYKPIKFFKLFGWILIIASIYIVCFVPNAFNSIYFSAANGFAITSGMMFKGALGRVIHIRWLDGYNFIYRGFIPGFVMIMTFVRAENNESKITRQNMCWNNVGVMLSWLAFIYISRCSAFIPDINAIAPIGYLPMVYCFIRANENDELVDFKGFIKAAARFVIGLVIPILILWCAFMGLLPVSAVNSTLFFVLVYLIAAAITGSGFLIRRRFAKSDLFRAKRYEEDFEQDITHLDFTKTPKEITEDVFKIFRKYTETSSMKILIDDGSGNLNAVYTSDDKPFSIDVDRSIGDVVMNTHRQVIFREHLDTVVALAGIKTRVTGLLDMTDSDAYIMLNEGRQFIGLILLGKKTSGNAYSEYDYEMFNKYYSNLFVVGYYVKNIMNESVVGTVNREIRMSGQIITSIQENMDLIKSKKVDAGYLMIPAHNIGGEFVDMIRLTDTRHIFIIGALSGKGIAASMNMVILKSIIRTYLAETTDFKKLVAKVNFFIRDSLPKGTFFSGIFGLMDFSSDTMYYINCGSPALFVYTRAYNNVIEVQGEGHILGFVKDILPYLKVKKVQLAKGDIVMSMTDGILDTRSLRGDIFGKTRTQTALMENSNFPAEKMAKFAYDSLVEFSSKELENDVTMLVMKYLGDE